jgi:hypothetical protein
MIEKPVASIKQFFNSATIQSELGLQDLPDGTLLFTESQLKAERERAINECLKIAKKYDNGREANYADSIYDGILKLLDN